jgi:hypothetical protein
MPKTSTNPPILKRSTRTRALAKDESEKGTTSRVHLRITSVRKRLIDPDNLFAKSTIDCLRYAKLIADDCENQISLEISQKKITKGEDPHTTIEIIYPKETLQEIREKLTNQIQP